MGRTLDIHPLMALVVTALGGLQGGIVGLILAVIASTPLLAAIERHLGAGRRTRRAHRATLPS